jgi:hypothetical protein
MDRMHSPTRRAWITFDISKAENAASPSVAGGMSALDLPKKPLANCKYCCSGKTYSAYYNAAAHLRRVHFNPRDSRKGIRPTDEFNRRRVGGAAGPPMDILRQWMREIEVVNHEVAQESAEDYPIKSDAMEFGEAPQDT